MPHPCPHHCPPERGGKAVLVLLAVIAAAALARPAAQIAVTVLEVAAITVGVILGLTAVAAAITLAIRRRASQTYALGPRAMRVIPPAQHRAITAADTRLPGIVLTVTGDAETATDAAHVPASGERRPDRG
jgi:hypothetical protein